MVIYHQVFLRTYPSDIIFSHDTYISIPFTKDVSALRGEGERIIYCRKESDIVPQNLLDIAKGVTKSPHIHYGIEF